MSTVMLEETGRDARSRAAVVRATSQGILAHATLRSATHAQMVRSPQNVRKKPRDLGELTALIRAQGLLQNLVCYEQQRGGAPTGLLVVAAGDGRWQAIGQLIADGSLPEDYQIPYLLVTEAEAVLVSLAENLGRTDLHAADLCAAMLALAQAGRSVADIALCLGLSELTVRRRLKLARVAPSLFALYRADQVSYEQMAALAVCDDHAAQEAAWASLRAWERQPHRLRRMLTQHSVPLRTDPVARYVGLKAYQAAGGTVSRDLFSDREDGYLDDPALLEALAHAKLERVARRLRGEQWAWLDIKPRTDAAALAQYGRVRTVYAEPDAAQAAQLQDLAHRIAALQAQADAAPEARAATARALADLIALQGRIRMGLQQPDPGDRALAGALVTVDADRGQACVLRGLIRPQDKGRLAPAEGTPAARPRAAHSRRLTAWLSAQRTLGLRAELVKQPEVAVRVLAHRLLSLTFYAAPDRGDPVQLMLQPPALPDGVQHGPAWERWQAAHAAIAEQLPPTAGVALMAWLQRQPRAQVDTCLAYCVSCAVNGVQHDAQPQPAVTALAQAVGLDMHAYWAATPENYFAHVSKARMMEVVAQAVSPAAAAALEKLPKQAAAAAAARALAGSRWLPALLAGQPVACEG